MTPQTLSTEQSAILALWYRVNASLTAYYKLINAFHSPAAALQASVADWQTVGIHKKHLERHGDVIKMQHLLDGCVRSIAQGEFQLVCIHEPHYPPQLTQLYDPPPLLFVRGNVARLQDAQIAIVGSRKPTPHAQKITFDMAQYLAQAGYVITSGLAQGVDLQAHLGALSCANSTTCNAQTMPSLGRTIGVMGTGIDVCYPRHHHQLFTQIVHDGGCLISELLPQTPANRHTFPRRNRLVAGLSIATIVTEAALKSGSLITARLTSEQGKQVFAIPSHIDNHNAEGCHHLIREGATLIYHPNQVLEEIRQQLPVIKPSTESTNVARNHSQNNVETVTSNIANTKHHAQALSQTRQHSQSLASNDLNTQVSQASQLNQPNEPMQNSQVDQVQVHLSSQPQTLPLPPINVHLSDPLKKLYALIDWSGTDVDTLVSKLALDTQSILGQLMELELMGLIMQQGGRYVRV